MRKILNNIYNNNGLLNFIENVLFQTLRKVNKYKVEKLYTPDLPLMERMEPDQTSLILNLLGSFIIQFNKREEKNILNIFWQSYCW